MNVVRSLRGDVQSVSSRAGQSVSSRGQSASSRAGQSFFWRRYGSRENKSVELLKRLLPGT
eukprot:905236-Rhodomonas_salina.2